MKVKKYDIVVVNLNPTKGSEQKGIRPCLVVQNNGANQFSRTTVVCPISSTIKRYPHTLIVSESVENGLKNESRIDLLQIRTVDQSRMVKKIGVLDKKYRHEFKERFKVGFDLEDLLV